MYACDTPNCEGTKQAVTPAGHVCRACATSIAQEIHQ